MKNYNNLLMEIMHFKKCHNLLKLYQILSVVYSAGTDYLPPPPPYVPPAQQQTPEQHFAQYVTPVFMQ